MRIACGANAEGAIWHLGAPPQRDCGAVPGRLSYKIPEQPVQIAAVSAGLVKIENNHVLILVDSAERPEDIDANRAQRAADQAREELLQKKSIQEYRTAQAQLARAISRLRVKNSYLEGKQ